MTLPARSKVNSGVTRTETRGKRSAGMARSLLSIGTSAVAVGVWLWVWGGENVAGVVLLAVGVVMVAGSIGVTAARQPDQAGSPRA